jgi:hypothetical protein
MHVFVQVSCSTTINLNNVNRWTDAPTAAKVVLIHNLIRTPKRTQPTRPLRVIRFVSCTTGAALLNPYAVLILCKLLNEDILVI